MCETVLDTVMETVLDAVGHFGRHCIVDGIGDAGCRLFQSFWWRLCLRLYWTLLALDTAGHF